MRFLPPLKTMVSILLLELLFGAALYLATPVFAQNDYGLTETARQTQLPRGATPTTVVANIINVLLGFVGALLIVLMVYAGFLWMTAQGNEEQVTKAKTLIRNSIIGLIIIFAAYTISSFIIKVIKQSMMR